MTTTDLAIASRSPADERRFERYVRRSSGCWEWAGHLDPAGYGRLTLMLDAKNWTQVAAHRLAFAIAKGHQFSDGEVVCHRCDNPKCVRPGHLFLGTNADNIADMVAKGRSAAGERNGQAKLSNDQAVAIRLARAAGAKLQSLATQYGVTKTAIFFVCRGESFAMNLAEATVPTTMFRKRTKLSDDDVCAMRRDRLAGMTLESLKAKYGVAISTISGICTGSQRRDDS